ncbi:HAD family hydrolase [Methylotenera mobilis]|uniref:phosphoglycolate phosphatase n=1 Tax=Methylotenera mobilis (strain JLW8 / ATCC BAA-1282 / DSM 17540) TaxID=583345 RepID=C6WV63_METML|nr:HAD-IA family hydrolase [Methylotenera mobilis]ACT47812.1 HAD-superfamily hydrolase, subfamily IA, variant 3 [Methylotenera mobilis JLW8]
MILFDLDGTLVDTAHDLAYALNLQRIRHGLAELPLDVIRPYASHGSKGLLAIGFDLSDENEAFARMRDEYLAIYDQVLTRQPILFDGIAELLAVLEANNIPWGVVTNKPRRFTQPLMQSIGLLTRAACVVSGDDAARPKPYPDTLFMACKQAGVSPQQCWYVGDAERDIQAGKAAGMQTVVALYGYLSEADQPETWGADKAIQGPLDLLTLVNLKLPATC